MCPKGNHKKSGGDNMCLQWIIWVLCKSVIQLPLAYWYKLVEVWEEIDWYFLCNFFSPISCSEKQYKRKINPQQNDFWFHSVPFVAKYMTLNTVFSCQLSSQSKVLLMNYKPLKIRNNNVNPDKILSYCDTNDNSIISTLLHIVMLITMHKIKRAILIFKTHITNMLLYYNTLPWNTAMHIQIWGNMLLECPS